jgi:16S rRNA (cytosine1402-N4)-methyltransferase
MSAARRPRRAEAQAEVQAPSQALIPGFEHRSVLLADTLAQLAPRPGGRYLDGTLGGGGHAELILENSGPDGILVGIDRDPAALRAAGERLARFGDRARLLRGRFSEMAELAAAHGPFDGVLLDIGTSSPQLDHADRGFSFMHDGPLDMRMDPSTGESAAELIDRLTEEALADVIYRYGEEPRSRRIAKAIVAGRPWTRTGALAACVAEGSGWKASRTHPATRTFQALRIAVNNELDELERALPAAVSLLAPGGRLAVISFHSLEDRIVKGFLRTAAEIGTARDAYGAPLSAPALRLCTRRAIDGAEADPTNPRSRSARLRVAERLPTA